MGSCDEEKFERDVGKMNSLAGDSDIHWCGLEKMMRRNRRLDKLGKDVEVWIYPDDG